ncbi:MAG: RNA polymerase sigma factor [Thermodesulfobacteriota bacterium]
MDQDRENEIIRRVKGGDREAFSLLVEEYKAPVFNLAIQMTGRYEDADDLAQDTFLKAYVSLWFFEEGRRFFPWLYTIALNLIRNHLKRQRRFRQTDYRDFTHIPDLAQGAEERIARHQEAAMMRSNLARLPLSLREAVLLRYGQGLTFEQAADVLGISIGATKMRVLRGLEQMRRLMEESSRAEGKQ